MKFFFCEMIGDTTSIYIKKINKGKNHPLILKKKKKNKKSQEERRQQISQHTTRTVKRSKTIFNN